MKAAKPLSDSILSRELTPYFAIVHKSGKRRNNSDLKLFGNVQMIDNSTSKHRF